MVLSFKINLTCEQVAEESDFTECQSICPVAATIPLDREVSPGDGLGAIDDCLGGSRENRAVVEVITNLALR